MRRLHEHWGIRVDTEGGGEDTKSIAFPLHSSGIWGGSLHFFNSAWRFCSGGRGTVEGGIYLDFENGGQLAFTGNFAFLDTWCRIWGTLDT